MRRYRIRAYWPTSITDERTEISHWQGFDCNARSPTAVIKQFKAQGLVEFEGNWYDCNDAIRFTVEDIGNAI